MNSPRLTEAERADGIRSRIAELEAANAAAPGWGAAVGARWEEIKGLQRELRRLTPVERANGMPFEVPFNEREAALQKEVRGQHVCPCCGQYTPTAMDAPTTENAADDR